MQRVQRERWHECDFVFTLRRVMESKLLAWQLACNHGRFRSLVVMSLVIGVTSVELCYLPSFVVVEVAACFTCVLSV